MPYHTQTHLAGGPDIPARLLPDPKERLARRKLADRMARWLVRSGGVAIILAILAIVIVILAEILPLFKRASALPRPTVASIADALALAVDEYRETGCVVTPRGIQFITIADGKVRDVPSWPPPDGAQISAVSDLGRGAFALGLSDGRLVFVTLRFEPAFTAGKRSIEPRMKISPPAEVDPARRPLQILSHVRSDAGTNTALAVGPKELVVVSEEEKQTPMGETRILRSTRRLTLPIEGRISALALDGRGEDLFAGTSDGNVVRIDLRQADKPAISADVPVTARRGCSVTVLGFLIGDRTLVVGDADGGVGTWQMTRGEDQAFSLRKIHDFERHASAVRLFCLSLRDKGFVTGDGETVKLHFGTTGKTLLTLAANARTVTFSPKANGILTLDSAGELSHWDIDNLHPEATLNSLFGAQLYEGYERPEYVWQSTGGTDDFEPKFSLTPLIYGTLKGTFYALLTAVPLALLGALYTSQFMHPHIKSYVKPTVEIMAALPSVVLGFIAGLWLAPSVEKIIPGLFLLPLVAAALIVAAVAGWRILPLEFRNRIKFGSEVFLLIPTILIAAWISLKLGSILEGGLLKGDYRGWILRTFGLTYDQRNSLVVGFAMGFAVIPIIFTIAEDSLSNVPPHLAAGSLALGATRWQTAIRVILPTASPGIFSAIMIGFGRAVGETMIVLMATGNTPVMQMSPFNGFRALSANIAVELPEAPEGGTHFRVLFVAALLLFGLTFLVNTAAEAVRLRLRKKYQYI